MPSLIKKISARAPSLPRIPEPESGEEEHAQRSVPVVNHNAWGESTVNGHIHTSTSSNPQQNHKENKPIISVPKFTGRPASTNIKNATAPQSPQWNAIAGIRPYRAPKDDKDPDTAPKSPADIEVSQYTHQNKTRAPRVRYNRTPVRLTVSGDWALKECEQLTTWTNKILKSSNAEPINDLRKSIGDGTTLVTLIETLSGGTIPGVNEDINSKQDRVENLKHCLEYLESAGVDLTAIDAEDIADGNLKATLLLVGNIHKKLEADDKLSPPCNPLKISLQSTDHTNSTIPKLPPGAVPVMPGAITLPGGPGIREPPLGVSDHPTSPTRRHVMTTEDLLPGILGKEELRIRPQSVPPGNIVSTTELSSNGVQQHGVEERRQQLMQHQSSSNFHRGYATRQPPPTLKPSTPKPQTNPSFPTTAWSNEGQKPQPMARGGSRTVEERLRSLIASPPSSAASSIKDQPVSKSFDDGELLQFPPPQPRRGSKDQGMSVHHHKSPSYVDQLGGGSYASTYVPSRPTERYQGSRSEAIMNRQPTTTYVDPRYERPHSRAGPLGHDNPAFDKSRDTSPVRTTNGPSNPQEGAAMRDAWNKLFGGRQPRPESRNMVQYQSTTPEPQNRLHIPQHSLPYHSSNQMHDSGNNYVDMTGRNGNTSQANVSSNIRSSPMGQSSSQGHGSSSQGQTSSPSQTSGGSVQVSPTGVSYQTFGKSVSNQSLEKSPTSPQAIGPASKYPDFGSRPSSAKNKQGGAVSKGVNDGDMYNQNSRLSSNVTRTNEMLDRNGGHSGGNIGSLSLNLGMGFSNNRPHIRGSSRTDSVEDSESALNDIQASIFDYAPSEASSRSVTPPLPPLSNTDSDCSSLPPSPKFKRSGSSLTNHKTPDLVTSTTKASTDDKKTKKVPNQPYNVKNDKRLGSAQPIGKFPSSLLQNGSLKRESVNGTLSDVRESGAESDLPFDIEDTILTVDSIDTEMQNMHQGLQNMHDTLQPENMDSMKERLNNLEGLYQEVLRIVGGEKQSVTTTTAATRRRWSLGSSDTSSIQRPNRKFKGTMTANQRHHHHHQKDIKAINRRFQRLESHVVTLARSVAHLSSELRSHNSMVHELESLRKEVRELKEQQFISTQQSGLIANNNTDFDMFRGWVPSLTNPKRINKLTKFFGQEPPLLELFLKKLGYEKFVTNFENEHIGMIELPYMTEDRLEKIGIPMGPRLRILQEAQLCFRQENFNIYIV